MSLTDGYAKERAAREGRNNKTKHAVRAPTTKSLSGNNSDMFDISDAYGRGISRSVGKFQKLAGQEEKEGFNQLASVGASPEQLLRYKSKAGRDKLDTMGGMVSSGNEKQAGAIFSAKESRNALAEQIAAQERMAGEQMSFQERMAKEQRKFDLENMKRQEKQARNRAWIDAGSNLLGTVISAALPLLG